MPYGPVPSVTHAPPLLSSQKLTPERMIHMLLDGAGGGDMTNGGGEGAEGGGGGGHGNKGGEGGAGGRGDIVDPILFKIQVL